MRSLLMIIDFLVLGTIIAIPFLILIVLRKLKVKQRRIYYFLTGIIISSLMICFYAWWSDYSNILLLNYYGYNMHGTNETELYEKVLPQNLQRVKNIENSLNGIGWTLKAIFGFITFIPYLVLVFIGNKFIKKKWFLQ